VSLDVTLRATRPVAVFENNITHNLGAMAAEAGCYEMLWRPEEIGVTHAAQLVKPLTVCLERLRAEPDRFKALNPGNGWGDYDGLVRFVEEYRDACRANPDATVETNR
jgi:hypothetical protein